VNVPVDGIVDRISKNCVTLLDVAPKADGTLPQEQIDGIKQSGDWMKHNKEALYAASLQYYVEYLNFKIPTSRNDLHLINYTPPFGPEQVSA
jgi:alpha-L-fucosidase